ncbi:MAG: hypothetical protein K2Q97_19455 [Burkholderiaceae bacterium]|nr:hypothetical protein [Burkholderiaceae bacterium]
MIPSPQGVAAGNRATGILYLDLRALLRAVAARSGFRYIACTVCGK